MTIASLHIKELTLDVYLGWPEKERIIPQTVALDIIITFHELPKACLTDNLADAICYSDLIHTIRENLNKQSFRLLEHFTCYLQSFIKNQLPEKTTVCLAVTKYPQIVGLNGGVQFYFAE